MKERKNKKTKTDQTYLRTMGQLQKYNVHIIRISEERKERKEMI